MRHDGFEELDERFADWVDGRLDPAELAALEAELAADEDLRQRAEEYRDTVARLREHLRPPAPPAELADNVMARLPGAAPARRVIPFLASLAAAAAMVMLYVVLRGLTETPQVRESTTAGAPATPPAPTTDPDPVERRPVVAGSEALRRSEPQLPAGGRWSGEPGGRAAPDRSLAQDKGTAGPEAAGKRRKRDVATVAVADPDQRISDNKAGPPAPAKAAPVTKDARPIAGQTDQGPERFDGKTDEKISGRSVDGAPRGRGAIPPPARGMANQGGDADGDRGQQALNKQVAGRRQAAGPGAPGQPAGRPRPADPGAPAVAPPAAVGEPDGQPPVGAEVLRIAELYLYEVRDSGEGRRPGGEGKPQTEAEKKSTLAMGAPREVERSAKRRAGRGGRAGSGPPASVSQDFLSAAAVVPVLVIDLPAMAGNGTTPAGPASGGGKGKREDLRPVDKFTDGTRARSGERPRPKLAEPPRSVRQVVTPDSTPSFKLKASGGALGFLAQRADAERAIAVDWTAAVRTLTLADNYLGDLARNRAGKLATGVGGGAAGAARVYRFQAGDEVLAVTGNRAQVQRFFATLGEYVAGRVPPPVDKSTPAAAERAPIQLQRLARSGALGAPLTGSAATGFRFLVVIRGGR